VTRATSPDGGWEYTLYDGGGGRNDEAFIHALDVVEGETVCIDLPMVSGREAYAIGLSVTPDGGAINVEHSSAAVATVDTGTFEVSQVVPVSDLPSADEGVGGPSGIAIGAIAAGLAIAIGTIVALRRRRQPGLPVDPLDSEDRAPAGTVNV
jgi:hypothetical protein